MGIQINGNTDTISAIDGSLAIQGASGNVTGDLTGNVTGNVNSTGVSTFSGGVVVAAGTTAAPSISPTGDSNTGIFFPSADTIAFAEGGVEALRVDSSGNVGINSTSPARKLDVVDSGASGSVVRSRVTTNNGGYLAYEALNSSGTSVFNVTHNGRINLSENIVFASGQGLDFSATANSSGTVTTEVLDDYERGTWTPSFVQPATSANIFVNNGLTIFHADYVKIGNLVYISCYIQNDASFSYDTGRGGSDPIGVGGLPFIVSNTPTNSGYHPIYVGFYSFLNAWSAGYTPMGYFYIGTNNLGLTYASTNTIANVTAGTFSSANSSIILSGWYRTN